MAAEPKSADLAAAANPIELTSKYDSICLFVGMWWSRVRGKKINCTKMLPKYWQA